MSNSFKLNGGFPIIYADIPWPHDNEQGHSAARGGMPYESIALDRLESMPIKDFAHKDCALFMWATAPKMPEAFYIMHSWGFKYVTMPFTWLKLNPTGEVIKVDRPIVILNSEAGKHDGFTLKPKDLILRGGIYSGLGSWTNMNQEFILLGKRGAPKRQARNEKQVQVESIFDCDLPEVILAPCSAHSAKPEIFRQRINEVMGNIPGLELFARGEPIKGWVRLGKEISGNDIMVDLERLRS